MWTTADAQTRPTASFHARRLRRARPRAVQTSTIPNDSESTRAASGTPGGSTPRTKSERFANSGVRADAMPIAPASAAPSASTAGAERRRDRTITEGIGLVLTPR